MHQVERLLNLIFLLLDSSTPVTFQRIREVLPEAYGQGSLEAAKRMFERDKDALRENGIPIEVAKTDVWEAEDGYSIRKSAYYLPDLELTAEELSALFVAAHASGEDLEAAEGLRKLSFAAEPGILTARPSPLLRGGPDFAGPQLGEVVGAVGRRRSISFGYRTVAGEVSTRSLDPFGVVYRSGHWYVVGLDLDRDETRSFRISRFTTGVRETGEASAAPPDFDPLAASNASPWGSGGDESSSARVAFTPRVAWWATGGVVGAKVLGPGSRGRTEIEIPFGDVDRFVGWVIGFGPDAEVVSPPEIRTAVRRRLEETLARL